MPEQKVPDLTSWTGWDVRGGARADPRAVQQFEDSAPTFPSAENRYQLLAVAGVVSDRPASWSRSPWTTASPRPRASRQIFLASVSHGRPGTA